MATDLSTITSSTLSPQPKLLVPTQQPDLTPYTSIIDGALTSLPDITKQIKSNQNAVTGALTEYTANSGEIANKEVYSQQQQDLQDLKGKQGVLDALDEELGTLTAQIKGLGRESQAIPLQVQEKNKGTGATDAGVAPQEADMLRTNAIKALTLASQGDLLLAKYNASDTAFTRAKERAQQAVDLKYKPLEARNAYIKDLLELNSKYISDPLEKKRQEATNVALNERSRLLELQKSYETTNTGYLVKAEAQGAPAEVVAKAREMTARGASPAEVAGVLGKYAGDYLEAQYKRAQLDELGLKNQKALDDMYGNGGAGLRQLSFEENAKFNSTPEAKKVKDATQFALTLSAYKKAIETYGTGEVFGKGAGAINSAYSSLVGAVKDYYTLGTLDNGVLKLVSLGIPEPSVWGQKSARVGAIDEQLAGVKDVIKINADQLLKTGYKNTVELKSLLDTASTVMIPSMTNEELLNQLPTQTTPTSPSSTPQMSNAQFFNR